MRPCEMPLTELDENIMRWLTDGENPHDIAAELCDQDVSLDAYEGCSSDLEQQFDIYQNRAQMLLEELM